MPQKLKCKIILESQDSVFDAVEVGRPSSSHGGITREKCSKFSPRGICIDNPIGQKVGIGNVNVDTHVLNAVEF